MPRINTFEDLDTWKQAKELCIKIHNCIGDKSWYELAGIKDQIYKSSGSVMDNIAEGMERDSKNELIYFLAIAKGSCGEVRSQIIRLYVFGLINDDSYDDLLEQSKKVSELIGDFLRYVKKSAVEGTRKK